MADLLIVVCAVLLGGCVQAATGFGGGIVIMIFLPMLFPMASAAGISQTITMALSGSIFFRYRKYVKKEGLLLALLSYTVTSDLGMTIANGMDAKRAKLIFGIFLVILAIYFIIFASKIKVRPSKLANIICTGLSGLFGGMFGIGGPPVSVYYINAMPTKEAYLGTLNLFFFITAVINTASRVMKGIITRDMVPYILLGVPVILIGSALGDQIARRVQMNTIKRGVYAVVALAGVIAIIQGIR